MFLFAKEDGKKRPGATTALSFFIFPPSPNEAMLSYGELKSTAAHVSNKKQL
jgi:hypothetical protein